MTGNPKIPLYCLENQCLPLYVLDSTTEVTLITYKGITFLNKQHSSCFLRPNQLKLEPRGGIAQLGARLNGIQEAVGSNPIISIHKKELILMGSFLCIYRDSNVA